MPVVWISRSSSFVNAAIPRTLAAFCNNNQYVIVAEVAAVAVAEGGHVALGKKGKLVEQSNRRRAASLPEPRSNRRAIAVRARIVS